MSLCRLQAGVDIFLTGFDRGVTITCIVDSLCLRGMYIFTKLNYAFQDRNNQLRDINVPLGEIKDWQRAMNKLVSDYEASGILTPAHRHKLAVAIVNMLTEIVSRNRDLLPDTSIFYAAQLHRGNLYQKWRREGEPVDLFQAFRRMRGDISALAGPDGRRRDWSVAQLRLMQESEEHDNREEEVVVVLDLWLRATQCTLAG